MSVQGSELHDLTPIGTPVLTDVISIQRGTATLQKGTLQVIWDLFKSALVSTDIPNLPTSKITSGVFPIGRIATGTADGTKFVDDTGALRTPPGGSSGIANVSEDDNPQLGGPLDADGNAITGLPDPAADSSPVTLQYFNANTAVPPSTLANAVYLRNDADDGVVAEKLQAKNLQTDGDIIKGQSIDVDPDGTVDFVMSYDQSALGLKKVLMNIQPAGSLHVFVHNDEGAQLEIGQAVYISGVQGGANLLPQVQLARADSLTTSDSLIGLVEKAIADNADGYVVVMGRLGGFDTTALSNGDKVYLSESVAGELTATRPSQPNFTSPIGFVTRDHATLGSVLLIPTPQKFGAFAQHRIAFGGSDGFIKESADFTWNDSSKILDVSGAITVSGNVDGRDVAADGTKLDTVAASAEVNPAVVSQADAEAGTATDERIWTAQRVAQAIAALGGPSGGTYSINQVFDDTPGGQEYYCISGKAAGDGAEGDRQVTWADDSKTLSKLKVKVRGQGTTARTVTLNIDGVATALVVTIPASAADGVYVDDSNTVAVTEGDLLSYDVSGNGFTLISCSLKVS